MTEGSTRLTRLGCTHPVTFRAIRDDGVPVIAPCSWCGPGFVLAEAAVVPTIGDGTHFVERQVIDPRLMFAHLADSHPPRSRVHYTSSSDA